MKRYFTLTSNSPEFKSFRETLRQLLTEAGLDEKKKGEVVLALDETLSNILRHAYPAGTEGKVEVDFSDEADRIEIVVRDFGKKFDLNQVPEPLLPPEKAGGLGVYFIKKLMDKAEHDPHFHGGNRLVLTKYK